MVMYMSKMVHLTAKRIIYFMFLLVFSVGCNDYEGDALDFDFVIPRDEVFAESIKEYQLFTEPLDELTPQTDVYLYELNSELFTDYAGKQRLIRLPEGAKASIQEDRIIYPNGTLLAKTFYFDADLSDSSQGRKIVETRLLIKREGQWNVATYQWNEEQSDAHLILEGAEVPISFIDHSQNQRQTKHQIPSEVACVTCHQYGEQSVYIGPTLKNLDRNVERTGTTVNQLEYMADQDLLPADLSSSTPMVNYKDDSLSLTQRARSYLDINCAHCHNPQAWSRPAQKDLNLHYEVPFVNTGISDNLKALKRNIQSGEMPFIGTTLKHSEGIELLLSYLNSL